MFPTNDLPSAASATRLQRSRERYGRLLAELRAAILAGERAPGEGLPSEHTLTAQYGLSRNTVRRALAALAAEGLVETQPGRGSFVTAPADLESRVHTLRLAVYYPSAQTAKLGLILRAFEEAHPLIRIQPLRLHPLGYTEAITGLLESGQGPDLVVYMNGMLPDLAPERHFVDLGEFLAIRPEIAGDTYALPLRLFQQEGRTFGLPFVFSPILLAYDRKALRGRGLPEPDPSWTWADLLDAGQRLTVREAQHGRVERYGCHVQAGTTRWPAMVFANGGALADPERGSGRLGEPPSVEAIQFVADLAHRYGVSGPVSGELDGEALFVLGRASMLLASCYGMDKHQFATSGIEWDVTLVPGSERRRHLFNATGVAICRQTTYLKSAETFMEFLLSRRIQELIQTSGCSLPVRPSIAEAPHLHDPRLHPQHLPVFLQAMAENEDTPPFYSSAVAETAHHELLLAFAGMEDASAACQRADATIGASLSREQRAPAAL